MGDETKKAADGLKESLGALTGRSSNYTKQQRVKKLVDMYDDCLDLVQASLQSTQYKGVLIVSTLMERIRYELDGLSVLSVKDNTAPGMGDNTLGWRYKPKGDTETIEA